MRGLQALILLEIAWHKCLCYVIRELGGSKSREGQECEKVGPHDV